MNFQDIAALAQLINPEGEEETYADSYQKGSVFAPSDIGADGKKKEIAKPFAQIEVKVAGNNQQQTPEAEQQKQPRKKDKNDIWDIDEVPVQQRPINDNRSRPDVDVMFKQQVGTEDVFGGWSGIDPSSTKCQALLVKIKLPQTKLAEINLEVFRQELILSSTKYYLHYILPYPVQDKSAKAKFISDKEVLELELQIVREELY